MSLKLRLRSWLFPEYQGLLDEITRLRCLSEANSDIHFLNLPFTPQIEEEAFQNVKAFEADLITGKVTIQDRINSLIEVLKRANLIQIQEAQ
jgi:hypothetical protein